MGRGIFTISCASYHSLLDLYVLCLNMLQHPLQSCRCGSEASRCQRLQRKSLGTSLHVITLAALRVIQYKSASPPDRFDLELGDEVLDAHMYLLLTKVDINQALRMCEYRQFEVDESEVSFASWAGGRRPAFCTVVLRPLPPQLCCCLSAECVRVCACVLSGGRAALKNLGKHKGYCGCDCGDRS